MTTRILATRAIVATLAFTGAAVSQDSPTAATYADIEATLGVVPSHFKAYPTQAIAGAFSAEHADFAPQNVAELLRQLKVAADDAAAAALCSGPAADPKHDGATEGRPVSQYLRLWPHRHHTDCFFAERNSFSSFCVYC